MPVLDAKMLLAFFWKRTISHALAIEFRKIVKTYTGKSVIQNISLAIPADITTAIVGESGSGKSTLLQLTNGLVRPDSGEVRVFGVPLDYENLTQLRRQMGYAVQGAGLFPHLSVQENITLVARLANHSETGMKQRYHYLLDLLELSDELSHRYPHSLSGGQQQRVSLCRAMMLNPPLLLLDEPFSALDPITRETIHTEFIALQKTESRSIVMVTHDMREALKLAQHLVILKDGEVVSEGSPEQLQDRFADSSANGYESYVAGLFQGIEQ